MREEKCNAPIEFELSIYIGFYLAISISLLIPTMNMCSKKCCCGVFFAPFLYLVYLFIKILILIILIPIIHIRYIWDWDDNLCPELKDLTLFWLIFNYIMLVATIVYSIFFGIVTCCGYDHYINEYDYIY